MKTKLLKKLRRMYYLEGQNGLYRVSIRGYVHNDQWSFYYDLDEAIIERRECILHYARLHYYNWHNTIHKRYD